MDLMFTNHAQHRQRNRAISFDVIDHVMAFGRDRHSGGTVVIEMDRKGREELRRHLGDEAYRAIEGRLDVFVVLSSTGMIVTVGHRTRGSREKASYRGPQASIRSHRSIGGISLAA